MFRTSIILILSLSLRVSAAIWNVFPGESIQQAVRSAASCDTVIIQDGDYEESVVLHGKTLTIGSLYLLDGDTAHVDFAIISADTARLDTNSCFVYAYGEAQGGKLAGLTLRNGHGTRWDTTVAGGTLGGAVHVRESNVALEYCRITQSCAYYGGGIGINGVPGALNANVTLKNCTLRGDTSYSWGGGIYARYCSLDVRNCLMTEDSSCGSGGACITLDAPGNLTACQFLSCVSYGSALALSGPASVEECLFEHNRTTTPDGPTDLEASSLSLTVSRCVFRNNATTVHSVILMQFSELDFVGNLIENMSAIDYSATLIFSGGHPNIAYNIIRNNVNSHGGAVQLVGQSTAHVHHNVFRDNSALDGPLGSAIGCTYRSYPVIDSNLFIGNTAPDITREDEPDYHPIIDARNNWWGDASGPYHPTQNPAGRGDTLLADSILFSPWLTAPPDTTMPADHAAHTVTPIARTWEFFGLYPNPFNSEIRLLIAGFAGRDFRLSLFNLLGQEVAVIHRGEITGGQISFQAPPGLSSGVYLVRAADGKSVQTKKAVFLK